MVQKVGRPKKEEKPNGYSENLEKPNGYFKNQKKAKKADNDNVNDSDNDNDNDNDSDSVNDNVNVMGKENVIVNDNEIDNVNEYKLKNGTIIKYENIAGLKTNCDYCTSIAIAKIENKKYCYEHFEHTYNT